MINQGKELGEADDIVFGTDESKKHLGSVGIMTKCLIDRAEYYHQPTVMALIPIINLAIYYAQD